MIITSAKKSLGQHFLQDNNIARKIVNSLVVSHTCNYVLEIGPGLGILTKYLLDRKNIELYAIDIDKKIVEHLHKTFPQIKDKIICGDFLEMNFERLFKDSFSIIGNFPYNISSQILFKVLDHYNKIPMIIGMFQKEVAGRLVACPCSKQYGILSVLMQAYYDIDILFGVNPQVFAPPPKVQSAVVRMSRHGQIALGCDEKKFKQVIKLAFGQRRKMLRNSLKTFIEGKNEQLQLYLFKRPEELSVKDFVALTNILNEN